jgi:acetoin utilization protein AcuB
MYEISYLLSKLKVDKVMTKPVITADENEVIEEAARIMADNDISCLPVMRGPLLVGIVTSKDLFHAFVNAFGARHIGVRISYMMEDKPGQIAKFSSGIAEKGGNIVAFISQEGDDLGKRGGTVKITGVERATVEEIFKKAGAEVLDIR